MAKIRIRDKHPGSAKMVAPYEKNDGNFQERHHNKITFDIRSKYEIKLCVTLYRPPPWGRTTSTGRPSWRRDTVRI
jgi:hypothetical protein